MFCRGNVLSGKDQCNLKVLNSTMIMTVVRGENVWKYVLEVHRRYICSVSLQLLTLHTCPVLLFIGPKSLVLLCQSLGHWVSDAFEFLSWTHATFPSLSILAVSFRELIELKEVNVAFIAEIYFADTRCQTSWVQLNLLKLFNVILAFAFAKQNQAEVWPRFQSSMPWVRCAFSNVACCV